MALSSPPFGFPDGPIWDEWYKKVTVSVNLSGDVDGTLTVPNGGTGATTLTGYVVGNGASAFTASATIPNTDITGLGTMSTQNADAVTITGGTITATTVTVDDEAYDATGWNGDLTTPTKNAVRDKIESLAADIASGTYTPTLTHVANISVSGAYACQYLRVGNTVTVSGKVEIQALVVTTTTRFRITLPVASAFTTDEDLAGVGTGSAEAELYAIFADATNDEAEFYVQSINNTNQHDIYFTFTYRII